MSLRRFSGRSAPGATVEGIEDLRKTLGVVLPREATNILRRTTLDIAREASIRVKAATPVKTGNLRRSIKHQRAKGTRTMVESKVAADRSGGRTGRGYHSHLVEFGYVHSKSGKFVPGRPFIVPTVEQMRPEVPKLYREQLGVQLEKEMQKRAKKAMR
jgi:hypothetical protein